MRRKSSLYIAKAYKTAKAVKVILAIVKNLKELLF